MHGMMDGETQEGSGEVRGKVRKKNERKYERITRMGRNGGK